METGIFCSVLILCSLASGAFLVVGIASPAWMKYRVEIRPVPRTPSVNNSQGQVLPNTGMEVITIDEELGLWNIYACVYVRAKQPPADEYTCTSMSFGELENASKSKEVAVPQFGQVALTSLLDTLRTVRMFAVTGVVAAALGLLLTCVFLWRSVEKTPIKIGALCACLWALTFLMAVITVSVQAQNNVTLRNNMRHLSDMPNSPMKMQVFFPWSIMLYGIGGMFAGLAGLMVLCRTLCIRREFGTGRSAVKWTRLTNEAEVDLRPEMINDEKGAPAGYDATNHH